MKQLLLIRHSKSSWDYPELADHDRPLNRRGQRDAVIMAERLVERFSLAPEAIPQTLYSSTATRALEFAQEISSRLEIPLVATKDLYSFSASHVLAFIEQLPDHKHRLALVGHNPALTLLCNGLAASNIDNLPTSGIIGLSSHCSRWADIDQANTKIDFINTPKATLEA